MFTTRNFFRRAVVVSSIALALATYTYSADPTGAEFVSPYAAWTHGPPRAPDYFPIAVWLQSPSNAARYRELGINLYVGLWKGPTTEQIAELKRNGMSVVCGQNEYALAHLDEPTIVGWMHGDEPDNAQPLRSGRGYGPPVAPEKIVQDYQQIAERDPSRPVLLNLGQGVAWDDWYGRGVRTQHPEDYPQYVRGADIVSFDIYPAVHDHASVKGKLWFVGRGVERLRSWADPRQPVWNCIECTRISNPHTKPTPAQVKAEVWMSLIHGSQGLIYFCHQFEPEFIEAGLLADDEMSQAVGQINLRVHSLAAMLNSPTLASALTVTSDPAELPPDHSQALSGPIAAVLRRQGKEMYVFAVRMDSTPARGTFQMHGLTGQHTVEVLDEDRTLDAEDGRFEDDFQADEVHLYRIRLK